MIPTNEPSRIAASGNRFGSDFGEMKGSITGHESLLGTGPSSQSPRVTERSTRRETDSPSGKSGKKKKKKKRASKKASKKTTESSEGSNSSGDHLWELGSPPSPSPLHYSPAKHERRKQGSASKQQSQSLSPAWDPLVLDQASWRKHVESNTRNDERQTDGHRQDVASPSKVTLSPDPPAAANDGTNLKAITEEVEGAWADFVNSPFLAPTVRPSAPTSVSHESSTSFTTRTTVTSTELTASAASIPSYSWKLPDPTRTAAAIIESPTPTSSEVEHLSLSLSTSDASSRQRLAVGSSSGSGHLSTAFAFRRHDSFKSVSVASTLSGNTDKYNTVASLMSAESRYNACGLRPEEEELYYRAMSRLTPLPSQHIRFQNSSGVDSSSLSQNSNSGMSISTHSKTTSGSWKGVPGGCGGPLTIFEGEPAMYSSSISFSLGGTNSSLDGTATGVSCASTIATDDGSCSIRSTLFSGKEQLMVEDLMSRGVPHNVATLIVKEHIVHLRTVLWNHRSMKYANETVTQQESEPPIAEAVLLNLPDNLSTRVCVPQTRSTQQPRAVSIKGSSETSLSFSGSGVTVDGASMPYPPSASDCSSASKKAVAFAPPVRATAVVCDDDIENKDDDTKSEATIDAGDGIVVADSRPLSIASLLREPNVQRFLGFMLVSLVAVVLISSLLVQRASHNATTVPQVPTPTFAPSAAPSHITEQFLVEAASLSGWVPVQTEGSPQRRALGWLSSVDNYLLDPDGSTDVVDLKRFIQRYSLIVFYFSTLGEDWSNQESWLDPNMHECGWSQHIFCKDDFTVAELNLNNKGLGGTLPRELQWLSLRVLRLSDNEIGGTIPIDLCAQSTSLAVVQLDHNKLAGNIPEDIAWCRERLQTLDLSHNRLQGRLPWMLGDLMNVQHFDLSHNDFEGPVPSNLLEGMSSLKSIDLRSNTFSGTIPSLAESLTGLSRVYLDNNRFSGTLPSSSLVATQVKVFTASNNQINDSLANVMDSFSGASDGKVKLETLDLSGNSLHGLLPSSLFGSLSELQYLDLSDNQLSGSLPQEATNSSLKHLSLARNALVGSFEWNHPSLTHLDISDNEFEGELGLDRILRTHYRLRTLILSRNRFWGTAVPTVLGSVSNLEDLQLASCGLGGSIPTEIGSLTKLLVVDLSKNELTGSIPSEVGNLASLQHLLLDGNSLEGAWPDELNSLPNLVQLAIGGNNMLSGVITVDLCEQANVTAEGMGCNMVGPCIPIRQYCG